MKKKAQNWYKKKQKVWLISLSFTWDGDNVYILIWLLYVCQNSCNYTLKICAFTVCKFYFNLIFFKKILVELMQNGYCRAWHTVPVLWITVDLAVRIKVWAQKKGPESVQTPGCGDISAACMTWTNGVWNCNSSTFFQLKTTVFWEIAQTTEKWTVHHIDK